MAWFGRKKPPPGGYRDNAALDAVGGFEPSTGFPPTTSNALPKPVSQPEPEREDALEPAPEFNAAPPRKKRGVKIGAIGFAVVVLWGGGYYVNQRLDAQRDEWAARPPSTHAPYTPPPKVVVPAVVEGWQSVAARDGSYAYDVPARWTPKPGTIHGWENPDFTMVTSAFYGNGFCPSEKNSRLAGAGVHKAQGDPASASEIVANEAATRAFTWDGPPPQVQMGQPEQVEIAFGSEKRTATLRLAEVTTLGGHPCLAKKAMVGTIALPSQDSATAGNAVLVVYADQTAPEFTTADEIRRMLGSYRGVSPADRTTLPASPTR